MTDPTPNPDALIEGIMTRISTAQRRRTLRARLALGAAVGCASLATVAGVWAAAAPPLAQEYAVYCYSAAALDAPFTLVASPDQANGEPVTGDRTERALNLCAGQIPGTSATELIPTGMAACERLDKIVGVFPLREDLTSEQLCAEIGLPHLGG